MASGRAVALTVDEAQWCGLARQLSQHLTTPLCIHLIGDLGTGKTTFVRAALQAAGHKGSVKSPSYGILEEYVLPGLKVLHLDLYRIGDPRELEFLAIGDLFDNSTVLFIEWPLERSAWLPDPDLSFSLNYAGEKRHVTIKAYTSSGNQLCQYIQDFL